MNSKYHLLLTVGITIESRQRLTKIREIPAALSCPRQCKQMAVPVSDNIMQRISSATNTSLMFQKTQG